MSHLPAFKKLSEDCADHFELVGDCLIVEEIPHEEQKTKGGVYIPTSKRIGQVDGLEANRPTFVRVLAVGNGYYDPKDERDIPLEVEVGDIILVGRMGIKWFSTFGPIVSSGEAQVGLTRESEIQLRFKGQHGYNACFAALKHAIETPQA